MSTGSKDRVVEWVLPGTYLQVKSYSFDLIHYRLKSPVSHQHYEPRLFYPYPAGPLPSTRSCNEGRILRAKGTDIRGGSKERKSVQRGPSQQWHLLEENVDSWLRVSLIYGPRWPSTSNLLSYSTSGSKESPELKWRNSKESTKDTGESWFIDLLFLRP